MRIRYNNYLLLIFLMTGFFSFGQQDPLYSQYLLNMMSLNPAYAGNKEYISLTSVYRNQWVNIDGAPKTYVFSGDILFDKRHVGLGASLIRDEIGIYSTNTLVLNYAYKILFKNNAVLSLGLSGSLGYQLAALSKVSTASQMQYNGADDEVFSGNIGAWLPNVGMGLFYNTSKFFVGISLPRTLNNSLAGNFKFTDNPTYYRQSRHVFLTSGYVFSLNEHYKLKPSFLIKYVNGSPLQGDINLQLWAYDAISFGFSYRTASSLVTILQMQVIPQLKVGYSYDHFKGKLSNKGIGAHEIILTYDFLQEKEKVVSPRYF